MDFRPFDIKHQENTRMYMMEVARIFDRMAESIGRLYAGLPTDVVFDINDHPDLKRQIEQRLRQMAAEIQTNIVNGINNEWALSNAKNDYMLSEFLQGATLPRRLDEKWRGRNIPALEAFRNRRVGQMGLSDRVWNLTKGHVANIERNLAIGIHDGMSAAELTRDIKQSLRNPDALFRRVRDAEGNLRLSRAAKEYHPGQGVYRSAYKNALRLTRTETNLAYQRADNERWKDMDFVLGVRVQRSNAPYDCDICEAGVGDYPKDYQWDSFHPNCRCRAIPLLADEEDFFKSVEAGFDGRDYKFDGYVEDIPDSFKEVLKTNYTHHGH